MVTVFAPAVLSMYKSKIAPAVAPSAAPRRVPVGRVIVVAAAEVEVIYPVKTCAAVAVAVALIAAEVGWVCSVKVKFVAFRVVTVVVSPKVALLVYTPVVVSIEIE
jgi:hypothetical protein